MLRRNNIRITDQKKSCKSNTCRTLNQHGKRGSNSRHPVLETGALPTELFPFEVNKTLFPFCECKGSIYFGISKENHRFFVWIKVEGSWWLVVELSTLNTQLSTIIHQPLSLIQQPRLVPSGSRVPFRLGESLIQITIEAACCVCGVAGLWYKHRNAAKFSFVQHN